LEGKKHKGKKPDARSHAEKPPPAVKKAVGHRVRVTVARKKYEKSKTTLYLGNAWGGLRAGHARREAGLTRG